MSWGEPQGVGGKNPRSIFDQGINIVHLGIKDTFLRLTETETEPEKLLIAVRQFVSPRTQPIAYKDGGHFAPSLVRLVEEIPAHHLFTADAES